MQYRVNTVVLRSDLSASPDFATLVQRTHNEVTVPPFRARARAGAPRPQLGNTLSAAQPRPPNTALFSLFFVFVETLVAVTAA